MSVKAQSTKTARDGESARLEDRHVELIGKTLAAANDGGSLEQPIPDHLEVVDTLTTYGACEEPLI